LIIEAGAAEGTLAGEARGVLDLDRAGHVEHPANGGVALARDLVGHAGVAEAVDDVVLPLDRLVARVGGVEQRLLVGDVGILLAQGVEGLARRVRRHRLRQELLRQLVLDERLHLRHRVPAHRERRLHHQPRVAQHFVLGVPLQQLVRHPRRYSHARQEHQREHDVELETQAHLLSLAALAQSAYVPDSPPDSKTL
jgi:hypothetical protein